MQKQKFCQSHVRIPTQSRENEKNTESVILYFHLMSQTQKKKNNNNNSTRKQKEAERTIDIASPQRDPDVCDEIS